MPTAIAESPIQNLADLLHRLGDIPLHRIRSQPPPGTATEQDVTDHNERRKPVCELVDGVLVEKSMGYYESRLAVVLIRFLEAFLEEHDLGIVLGEAGTLKLMPGLVRIPDVSFISWRQFPDRLLPREPIPRLTPDLAVEVLSESNTEREMTRKLGEYFQVGAKLVWIVDPDARTVRVYTSPRRFRVLGVEDSLTGGKLLPGFELSIGKLFQRAGQKRER